MNHNKRSAFTLMELLVVLIVLIALTAIIIPRITGVSEQAQAATSASIIAGINQAEARYEAQFGKIASGWDGVLNSSGAPYSKLHTDLTQLITAKSLSDEQVRSLVDAGMTGVHMQDEAWTGAPSDSGRLYTTLVDFGTGKAVNGGAAGKFAFLNVDKSVTGENFDAKGGHNTLFCDKAFSINPFRPHLWNNDFIVFGFGNESSLKNNATQDAPVFLNADPENNYARGLCVFMVPGAGQPFFKARYIGAFAPNGTCLMDNVDDYNKGKGQVQ